MYVVSGPPVVHWGIFQKTLPWFSFFKDKKKYWQRFGNQLAGKSTCWVPIFCKQWIGMENESKKEFLCYKCGLKQKYNYFGTKPSFAKSIVLLEETYIMKDPFSSESGIICLGSHCSLCQKSVCASLDCSLFYSKRFCLTCVEENIDEFPIEIQQELKKRALQNR